MSRPTVYPSLAGEAVFITGGATGIGAAMVEAFALQGAKVGFVDLDVDSAERLVSNLETVSGHRPWFREVDVTHVPSFQAAISAALDEFGPFLALINNVANDTRHSPLDLSEDGWRKCMAVNLDATFFASQAVFPGMQDRGRGSIINFSSINAIIAPANMAGYVTAKAGLLGMTKALARDFGTAGVRVNAILPGWVVTERQLEKWLTPEEEAAWMQQVALKKRLLPEDVANLALFLAADDSAMITGQSFTVDGGRT